MTMNDARLRALGERWLPVSMLVWVVTWIVFASVAYHQTPRPPWQIIYFPLWGPPAFIVALRLLRFVLRLVF
jgi:hypothetical protein